MINGDVQNHGNVQYHAFPRFWHFVRRNVWDTGAIFMQDVIPVISVQPILYQLPDGAKKRGVFFMVSSINFTDPHLPQKKLRLSLSFPI